MNTKQTVGNLSEHTLLPHKETLYKFVICLHSSDALLLGLQDLLRWAKKHRRRGLMTSSI